MLSYWLFIPSRHLLYKSTVFSPYSRSRVQYTGAYSSLRATAGDVAVTSTKLLVWAIELRGILQNEKDEDTEIPAADP